MPEPLLADKTSHVQTIYFGGFFPWLADKRTQANPDMSSPSSNLVSQHALNDGQTYGARSAHLKQARNKNNGYRRTKDEFMGSSMFDKPQAANSLSGLHQSASQPASTSAMQYTNSENRHQLGMFILPAVRLALDHINSNHSILSAYKLEVVPRDTQVSYLSFSHMFSRLCQMPTEVGKVSMQVVSI